MSGVSRLVMERLAASRLRQIQAIATQHQQDRPLSGVYLGWNAKTGQALIQVGSEVVAARPLSNGHPAASPIRVVGGPNAGSPEADWLPHRPDEEPESRPLVWFRIWKERLGDVDPSELFDLEVKLGGAVSLRQLGDRIDFKVKSSSTNIELSEPNLPTDVFATFSPKTAKYQGNQLVWQESDERLTSRDCICTNCRPFTLFAGVTNRDNPTLDLSSFQNPGLPGLIRRRVAGRLNPKVTLRWRLIEVEYEILYAEGEVSEEGELVGLPPEFESEQIYNGYMEVQIGCCLKNLEAQTEEDSITLHWPGQE